MVSLRWLALVLFMSLVWNSASADERLKLTSDEIEQLVTCSSVGTLLLVAGVDDSQVKQEVNRIENLLWADTPSTERDDAWWGRHERITAPLWASVSEFMTAAQTGDEAFLETNTSKALSCAGITGPQIAIIGGAVVPSR